MWMLTEVRIGSFAPFSRHRCAYLCVATPDQAQQLPADGAQWLFLSYRVFADVFPQVQRFPPRSSHARPAAAAVNDQHILWAGAMVAMQQHQPSEHLPGNAGI